MCNIQFLGIKIADSASVMKHRPLLSIIQFALSTGFLPFMGCFRLLPSFYQLFYRWLSTKFLPKIFKMLEFSEQRCFAVFELSTIKKPHGIGFFCVTQCDSVVLSVKLVCL